MHTHPYAKFIRLVLGCTGQQLVWYSTGTFHTEPNCARTRRRERERGKEEEEEEKRGGRVGGRERGRGGRRTLSSQYPNLSWHFCHGAIIIAESSSSWSIVIEGREIKRVELREEERERGI